MKREFKAGDRVRVYWRGGEEPPVAEVIEVRPDGLRVRYVGKSAERFTFKVDGALASPKQCRRLVKKPLKEFKAARGEDGGLTWDFRGVLESLKPGESIVLREVRK